MGNVSLIPLLTILLFGQAVVFQKPIRILASISRGRPYHLIKTSRSLEPTIRHGIPAALGTTSIVRSKLRLLSLLWQLMERLMRVFSPGAITLYTMLQVLTIS